MDSTSDYGATCIQDGNELFQTWTTLLVRWVTKELAAEAAEANGEVEDDSICDEGDEDCEDLRGEGLDGDGIEIIDVSDMMLSSNFITLTMDLAFKCNYVATLEGIIANKMIVDTVMALDEFIPYWILCIAFFIITLPVNGFTLVDDILGGFMIW